MEPVPVGGAQQAHHAMLAAQYRWPGGYAGHGLLRCLPSPLSHCGWKSKGAGNPRPGPLARAGPEKGPRSRKVYGHVSSIGHWQASLPVG